MTIRRRAVVGALAGVALAIGTFTAVAHADDDPPTPTGGFDSVMYAQTLAAHPELNFPEAEEFPNLYAYANVSDHAEGDQIYTCTSGSWTTTPAIPDADSTSPNGIGFHHYRELPGGPVWQSTSDGSLVEADARAQNVVSVSNGPGNIPLLRLKVARNQAGQLPASGQWSNDFAGVEWVQRFNTVGGTTDGFPTCDASLEGETRRSHYSADYIFLSVNGNN